MPSIRTSIDLAKLRVAMEWVIPTDSSPGAGSDACMDRLIALVDSLDEGIRRSYERHLGTLMREELDDLSNTFAGMFIDHVRDVYYGSPDTGAWEDIRFEVTG